MYYTNLDGYVERFCLQTRERVFADLLDYHKTLYGEDSQPKVLENFLFECCVY